MRPATFVVSRQLMTGSDRFWLLMNELKTDRVRLVTAGQDGITSWPKILKIKVDQKYLAQYKSVAQV